MDNPVKKSTITDNPYGDNAVVAIRGYRSRITPGTRFKVIEIDFTADPAKDNPEWLANQYREMGESWVRREVLRDYTVAAGDAFYPEYTNHGGAVRYRFRVTGIIRQPVIRGWDLGMRRPVCIFMQIPAPRFDRVYVVRALASLRDVDSYTMADLVKLVSGQIREEDVIPECAALYLSLLSDGFPRAPWFPAGTEFIDIAGPEADARTPNARPDDPRTTRDVFASKGIILQAPRVLVVDRVKVLRKLLHIGRNNRPSILISDDVTCDPVHDMLNGGLSFPKGTTDNPTPVKPRKDGWFDDIHDALTYPIAEMVPVEERAAVQAHKVWGGKFGREPITVRDASPDDDDDLGWYELRQKE